MAFTGWKKHKESILLRFAEGSENIKGGQVEVLEEYFEADVRKVRQITPYDITLLGTDEFSLSGVIAGLNAVSVNAATALVAKQNEIDEAKTELAKLRAELKVLKNPPQLVRVGILRKAIKQLDIAKRWETAIDATEAVLKTAGDPDPKRIVEWWYSDQPTPIDITGDNWTVIMTVIKFQAPMNESTLLAKIAEIQAL